MKYMIEFVGPKQNYKKTKEVKNCDILDVTLFTKLSNKTIKIGENRLKIIIENSKLTNNNCII